MTDTEIKNGLGQFCGTEGYHRWSILFPRVVLTDGAKWLAENAGCYWLADAIASWQPKCRKDELLRGIQFWTLRVDAEKKNAVLICERDAGDEFLRQEIPYTDFPLPEVKLWVEACEDLMVILLPGEH